MDYESVASEVLKALGGPDNITSAATCVTRLRLKVSDALRVDAEAIKALRGVLGVAARGTNGVEIVFGPSTIEGVAAEFASQAHVTLETPANAAAESPLHQVREHASKDDTERRPEASPISSGSHIRIPAGRKHSYRAQQKAAIEDERLEPEDIAALKDFLSDDTAPSVRTKVRVGSERAPIGRSLLVVNGPNINMLGLREPNIYGRQDYGALVRLCKDAAHKAGFADVRCFQSNHEGAIVDEIQAALGTFDGIVINPAAYTHTSVAILDAVKAVGLPCIEVHISKVEEREGFRQVSYVRAACIETITGMGLEGYRKAIFDMAQHLGM